MIIDATHQDWVMIGISIIIIFATLSTVFLLKLIGLERWQIRKIGHMVINTVAAFFPLLFENFIDLIITLSIAIGFLLLLSAIPKIRILQRIFMMCSRKESFPWELFINAVVMGIAMLLILWFFRDNLFVFTAAYLTVSLGDGLGEMIGRPYGRIKYKIFNEKSLEGSVAVFVGTLVGLIIAIAIGHMLGEVGVLWKIIVIALMATIVEAFSVWFLDNITLPATVAIAMYLFFLL